MKDFANWCPTCGKWKEICSHGKILAIKDMLGNDLKVGSVIAYPGRGGSSLWVSLSIVRGEKPGTDFVVPSLQVYTIAKWKEETLVASEVYCVGRVLRVHPEDYNDTIKWMVKEFWTNKPEGKKCTSSAG